MPTNRPFLSNFLAVFRAHSAWQKAVTVSQSAGPSTAKQTSYAHTSSSSTPSTNHPPSGARTIVTKTTTSHSAGATTAAVEVAGQFSNPKQPSSSSYTRQQASPPSPGFGISGPVSRQRRGSDSSGEGFRDVSGAEKWYIGGRTATGEERFYKLGMVKRYRSADRLSMDRLSL